MEERRYLPSSQFSVMAASLALAGGLVVGAQYLSAPQQPTAIAVADDSAAASQGHKNWEATLYQIEAQQGGAAAPQPAGRPAADELRKAAQSSNVTDTIGRRLLVNVRAAQSQGLGSDAPTKQQLLADALNTLEPAQTPQIYSAVDLTIVGQTNDSLHAYGNGVIVLLQKHPQASLGQTLSLLAAAMNSSDPGPLATFTAIAADYRALAKSLAATPVPLPLEEWHLSLVNDYAQMATTYADMRAIVSDPVRGLSGLQRYKRFDDDAQAMFINITQAFDKDGILFTKDEPGALWALLLSPQ